MRIPFLRPKAEAPTAAPLKPKRSRAAKAAAAERVVDVMDVEAARTQARRRLVGALVLLLIGVVGFPVLFETQPRPLPLDTPMEAVRREGSAGGPVSGTVRDSSPARMAAAPLVMPPSDAGNEEAAPAGAASNASGVAAVQAPAVPSATKPASAAATVAVKPASTPVVAAATPAKPAAASTPAPAPAATTPPASPKPATAPATVPATSPVAAASATPKAASEPATEAAARFVVQAGAYKENGKLREARGKIEALGFKTYTQVVENDNGSRTRVRVGPFPTHEAAEAVAAKIKRAGLPAAIVKL